jgi:hypothetical protein
VPAGAHPIWPTYNGITASISQVHFSPAAQPDCVSGLQLLSGLAHGSS